MNFVWPTSHVGMLHPLAKTGSRAHKQGKLFMQMARAAYDGRSYATAKELFSDVDPSTVETRKSLYEELGLLYVPNYSGKLHLTSVGGQLFKLLEEYLIKPDEDLHRQVDSLLCWAMTHTQINRPQSLGSPAINSDDRKKCDIRPYAAFWQAMIELDAYISFDEFCKVLAHVQMVSDFPSALKTIRDARGSSVLPNAPNKSGNFGIYWKAHLSVAESVLQFANGVFTFKPNRYNLIKSILHFQRGCDSNDISNAIKSKSWSNVYEYYSVAGEECPEFIASGQVIVESFGGQKVVILKGYNLEKDTDGYIINAGIELCELKINMPCFHASEQYYLLRVDQKVSIGDKQIQIRFGLGRPINNSTQLLQLWNN